MSKFKVVTSGDLCESRSFMVGRMDVVSVALLVMSETLCVAVGVVVAVSGLLLGDMFSCDTRVRFEALSEPTT